jgi:hypothetical protein
MVHLTLNLAVGFAQTAQSIGAVVRLGKADRGVFTGLGPFAVAYITGLGVVHTVVAVAREPEDQSGVYLGPQ